VNTHEQFDRSDEPEESSDRVFGLIVGTFCAIFALLPILRHERVRWWSMSTSGVLLLLAVLWPRLLHTPNRLWARFGMLLSRIVNPVVTAILFYLVVTPAAVMMRLLGKDLLQLHFNSHVDTYWTERLPPGPPGESMSRQF
jgi:hypothetical protein